MVATSHSLCFLTPDIPLQIVIICDESLVTANYYDDELQMINVLPLQIIMRKNHKCFTTANYYDENLSPLQMMMIDKAKSGLY